MAKVLSLHFTLEEMTVSDTAKKYGISNLPTAQHEKTLIHTCQYLLEPLRTLLNTKYKSYGGKKVKYVSIRVTSGYRSATLNAKIPGSAKKSQHLSGEAADIEAKVIFEDNTSKVLPYTELYKDVKGWVKEGKLSVDQLIQEKSGNAVWVHVSHSAWGKSKDRKQFLIYDGKTYKADK